MTLKTKQYYPDVLTKHFLGRYFVCLNVFFISGLATSADLLSSYRDALAYDAQYTAARANREAGIEKLPQARAGLLPSLQVSTNTQINNQDSLLRLDNAQPMKARYNTNGWTVQLSQPLFRWQNWVSYTQAELAVTASDLEFQNAQQDLILRVSQAYFDVLFAEETVATAEAQIAGTREQLAAAKKNFELGVATITDTHEAQARLDLAVAQLLAAQSDLLVKQQTLQTLTGKNTAAVKRLRKHLTMTAPLPADSNQWADMATQNNLQVLVQQSNAEIAGREVEKQGAGHLPTVDIVATRGTAATGNSIAYGIPRPGSDVETTTVGVQLTMPIFTGGSVNSKQREAVALKDKALAQLDHARRLAALNARQAYLGVSSGLAQIRAYETALTSSQSSVESNKLGYQVGVRINIDVLNAQSQLYETRQKLAKAHIDTLLSQLKLKSAAGNLGEDDVRAINGFLE
jgi:outer membrane protein